MGVGTLYLPPPPPVCPGEPCRARSVHGAWGGERWGRGRGRSGHRRASFYPPPSLGTTPKKIVPGGRGGRGGGNHPQHQTRPSPYPPPSLPRTKGPKVRGLDGSGKGVGRGGTSRILIRRRGLQGQALLPKILKKKNWGEKKFGQKNFGANRFMIFFG